MRKKSQKEKSGFWLNLILICSIIALGLIVFYFSVIDIEYSSNEISAAMLPETLKSTITEYPSSLNDVSIIHMKAEHSLYPFEIDYPKTQYKAMNQEIITYITKIKNDYINKSNTHTNKERLTAQLTISVELYHYASIYLLFINTYDKGGTSICTDKNDR